MTKKPILMNRLFRAEGLWGAKPLTCQRYALIHEGTSNMLHPVAVEDLTQKSPHFLALAFRIHLKGHAEFVSYITKTSAKRGFLQMTY